MKTQRDHALRRSHSLAHAAKMMHRPSVRAGSAGHFEDLPPDDRARPPVKLIADVTSFARDLFGPDVHAGPNARSDAICCSWHPPTRADGSPTYPARRVAHRCSQPGHRPRSCRQYYD